MGSVTRRGGQDRENTKKGNERNDKSIKVGKEKRERKREQVAERQNRGKRERTNENDK